MERDNSVTKASQQVILDFIEDINRRLNWALKLTNNVILYKFVRHDGTYSCDFGGYLLVCLRDWDTKFCVSIQDADDSLYEIILPTKEKGLEVFNKIFEHEICSYATIQNACYRYRAK